MSIGQKLAVLIDADNTSHKTIGLVLQEITKYGLPIVKRVYGDWSSEIDENGKPTNALYVWRDVSLMHAITPVQQFAYTKGKDATDMMLIINAMDLLHGGGLDGFCIVSSDSDFTPLASRIRESGLVVYGFGKRQTPNAFINACDKFIYIENLENEQDKAHLKSSTSTKPAESQTKTDAKPATKSPTSPIHQVQVDIATINLIYKAIKDIADDDGWANLADLGKHLTALKPDFDTRTYGRAKLSGLLQALDLFEVKQEFSQKFVRKKPSFIKVLKITQEILKDTGVNQWCAIDTLAGQIAHKHPEFNPKDFGFDTLADTIRAIDSRNFEFDESKQHIKLSCD